MPTAERWRYGSSVPARNAAFAEDFVGAAIILVVFALMTLWFRRLQSGKLY